jgi:hypothetical protein
MLAFHEKRKAEKEAAKEAEGSATSAENNVAG